MTTNNGIGLGWIFFIVFLVLKLCNVITWSWVWVCSPIWIPLAVCAVCFGIAGILKVFFE